MVTVSDSRSRSLAKAVSWRLAGSLSTVVIVYFFSGQLDLAAIVGGFELVAKIGLFYLHERIWANMPSFEQVKRTVFRRTVS